MTNSKLVILAALFLVLFGNLAFFKNVTGVYAPTPGNMAFLVSLAVLLTSVTVLLLILAASRYTTKPVLIIVLLVSSLASYFMDNYGVVIDHTMIQSIVQTNLDESTDLFSFKLILYFLFLGILPSVFIYKIDIANATLKTELISKLKVIGISLLIIVSAVLMFSRFYTSFFREHKPLRYYTNPAYYIYSTGKYINSIFKGGEANIRPLGMDAKISHPDTNRELIILVVGEAARADRFSLNGYARETNPLLKKENIINFPNMYSCGTSTAVSVPCMFSIFGRVEYSDKKAKSTENLLDVLRHAGVNVLWRDNNSDSKGVALNVAYEDFKNPKNNPVCDIECRDEGMLYGLQDYISRQKKGDILIVLHQMGNHGPAYYKRYPESFEHFKPVCKTGQLEKCTREEIGNTYDNAILYTDYFLSKVIGLLKQNTEHFEAAMIYMSDHGESLGENGLYLHGLPYFMAPNAQKHIGAVTWFGDGFNIDTNALRDKSLGMYSHDHLFHTILGLMEVGTSIYDKNKDISNYAR